MLIEVVRAKPHLVHKILCHITVMKSARNMMNFLKLGVKHFQTGLALEIN